jgi:hypothetical protein
MSYDLDPVGTQVDAMLSEKDVSGYSIAQFLLDDDIENSSNGSTTATSTSTSQFAHYSNDRMHTDDGTAYSVEEGEGSPVVTRPRLATIAKSEGLKRMSVCFQHTPTPSRTRLERVEAFNDYDRSWDAQKHETPPRGVDADWNERFQRIVFQLRSFSMSTSSTEKINVNR